MNWINRAIENSGRLIETRRGGSVGELATQLINIPLYFKNTFYMLVAFFFFLHLIYRVVYIIGSTESNEAVAHKVALVNTFVFTVALVGVIEFVIALIGWFSGLNIRW